MQKRRSRNRRQLPRIHREWVVGQTIAPAYVAADGGYSPTIVLILEPPVIVGSCLLAPDEPLDYRAILEKTMRAPAVGPPRKPSTLRVADRALAQRLDAEFPDLDVVLAPTPEFDDALQFFAEHLQSADGPDYSGHGTIPDETIRDLFEAASVFYLEKPWSNMRNSDLLRVDCPAFDVRGGCLVVMGNGGQEFGLLFFPSAERYADFEKLAKMRNRPPTRKRNRGETMFLALNLERATELSPAMRKDAARAGWPVAAPEAYPVFRRHLDDLSPVPVRAHEVALLAALARSVCGMHLRCGSTFDAENEIQPFSVSISDARGTVRYTYPYEAYESFERG